MPTTLTPSYGATFNLVNSGSFLTWTPATTVLQDVDIDSGTKIYVQSGNGDVEFQNVRWGSSTLTGVLPGAQLHIDTGATRAASMTDASWWPGHYQVGWLGGTATDIASSGTWRILTTESPRDQKRQRLKANLRPAHLDRALRAYAPASRFDNAPAEELTALRLLRGMVSPEAFRRYLKYGFVVARGASGLDYQIRRGQAHVIVRDRDQVICELCVTLRDRMPPTDGVVAKMVIVECDEVDIWRRANVYPKNAVQYGDLGAVKAHPAALRLYSQRKAA